VDKHNSTINTSAQTYLPLSPEYKFPKPFFLLAVKSLRTFFGNVENEDKLRIKKGAWSKLEFL
jgi:hypothetical protein